MVPSIRTVDVAGWLAEAKALRCAGRIRGVAIEAAMIFAID
jgi:hypothetical protein